MNFIYGGLLIAVVITTWLSLFPKTFLPAIVGILGVLILFTPMISGGRGVIPAAGPRFQWLRRYVFGIYLIISSIMSYVDIYSNFPWLARTSIYTFSGQLILLGIGAIYFLAAFEKTRRINIQTY